MLKALRTLFAVACFAAAMFVATRQQKATITAVTTGRLRALVFFIFDLAGIAISLALFWNLTGLFSLAAALILVALLVVNYLLNEVIGAISGFTLPDRQRKIGILAMIFGAERGVSLGIFGLVLGVIEIVLWVTTIVIFLRHPVGEASAAIKIGSLIFLVPQLLMLPLWVAVTWPMVTSEYVDNDVRDSHLARAFSRVFLQSITLAYPIWLLQAQLSAFYIRHHWRPESVWFIVSLPLLSFIFGAVIPFFVGIYRRKSELARIHDWREAWLSRLSQILILPDGPSRKQSVNGALEELTGEIQDRFSNNTLFAFYEESVTPNVEPENRLLTGNAGEPSAEVATDADSSLVRRAKNARERLRGHMTRRTLDTELPPLHQVQQIVINYRSKLVEWDLRFTSIDDLLGLYEIISQTGSESVKPYIDARLKDVTAKNVAPRSVIAATLLTLISSSLAWAAKEFGSDLLKLVRNLISF